VEGVSLCFICTKGRKSEGVQVSCNGCWRKRAFTSVWHLVAFLHKYCEGVWEVWWHVPGKSLAMVSLVEVNLFSVTRTTVGNEMEREDVKEIKCILW
jgi:hypothetical protein